MRVSNSSRSKLRHHHKLNGVKKIARQVLESIIVSFSAPSTYSISIEFNSSSELSQRFYSLNESEGSVSAILVVLNVNKDAPPERNKKPGKMFRAFLSASNKLNVSILSQTIIPCTCQDSEAATVVAVQHFCYQNRVFVNFDSAKASGLKRKHCSR